MSKSDSMQQTTPPVSVEGVLATEADGQTRACPSAGFFEARIRTQAENIINSVFPPVNALTDPFPRGSARYELRELITKALLVAHAATSPVPDASKEYVRGLSDGKFVAQAWAESPNCSEPHEDNPCCHKRTGAGIADAIERLISQEGTKK